MLEKEKIKEYSNDDITIVWKAKSCIHAAECIKRLPKVYNPNNRPWINIENADTESLMKQVDACPSGALTYYKNGEKMENKKGNSLNIQVLANGPLLVQGQISVEKTDGSSEEKSATTAFCRCGASSNKPYCDGSHSKVGFKDE